MSKDLVFNFIWVKDNDSRDEDQTEYDDLYIISPHDLSHVIVEADLLSILQ